MTGRVIGARMVGKPVGVYILVALEAEEWELKNIAIAEGLQGQGVGRQLLDHAVVQAKELGARVLKVGTGNSSLDQLRFYEAAGFERENVDKGFFLRNYEQPIFENGIQCTDMIFLAKQL